MIRSSKIQLSILIGTVIGQMSCVIGYRSGDVLYIAADSAATTEDGDIRSVKVNKIFRNGKYISTE